MRDVEASTGILKQSGVIPFFYYYYFLSLKLKLRGQDHHLFSYSIYKTRGTPVISARVNSATEKLKRLYLLKPILSFYRIMKQKSHSDLPLALNE